MTSWRVEARGCFVRNNQFFLKGDISAKGVKVGDLEECSTRQGMVVELSASSGVQ